MPRRSFTRALLVLWIFGSTAFAKDRILDRIFDRDLEGNQADSPPEAVESRSQAESAYLKSDFPRVIDLTTRLIANYPDDHAYIAYHLRASAKIELGRAANSAKQVRDGITTARQGLVQPAPEYPWLDIPYLYGLTSLAEIERRPGHADMAIQVVSPVLKFPISKGFTDDDRANLFYQRGLAYAAKSDFKMAAADQSEALRLSPDHLGAHVKRAEALGGPCDSKAA